MVSENFTEKTTYIYRGKRVSLKILETRLPNGKLARKEVVEHPGAVVILPVLDDGKIILLKQFRPSVGVWVYELPAGTLDRADESPEECAIRELEEETGFRPGKIEALFKFYPSPGYCTEIIHAFVARDLKRTAPKRDESEVIETLTLSVDEAIELVRREKVADGKTMLTLLYYTRL